jgi:hypothetical protein
VALSLGVSRLKQLHQLPLLDRVEVGDAVHVGCLAQVLST